MNAFFPRNTAAFRVEEATSWRRISRTLPLIAALTGIVVRVYRALSLTYGPRTNLLYVGVALGVGLVILLAGATVHLGNYTWRRWTWRAPLFWLVEVAAESITSLLLIAIGIEALGSTRAVMRDWPGMLPGLLLWRGIVILGFTLVLALVVQLVLRGKKELDGKPLQLDDEPLSEGS